MEITRIKDMKNLSILAIIIAAITFAACSGDENLINEQTTARTFTLVVNAAKGDDATTRALTLDGITLKAIWAVGEAVTVYNVTRSADLTGTLTAQSNGASTTLVGSLTGTIVNGDVLTLKFLSPTYTSQDGTLATIATTCDYAEATVTVTDASTPTVTTTAATFENQQAIVKFTLKNKATDAAINATKLTVTAGGTIINVTPASATDVLYVAIPGISSQTVYLSATAGGTGYTYEKSGVTLTNGHYYGFTVSMDEAPDATSEPLTFEAKEAGATVTFTKGTSVPNQIEYSTDGTTWTTYSSPITLANIGDKVYFRGDNSAYGSSSSSNSSHLSCSRGCYIYGNILSLTSSAGYTTATELTENHVFSYLFSSNNQIFNHPSKKLELPSTTLTYNCYNSMFKGCTNLTLAPELPATTLAQRCYSSMFRDCTSLTTAPALPATTLADYCYEEMFKGCTGLTAAPALPATTLADYCYQELFSGCTGLTIAPTLPATTLANYCYTDMFSDCISLTTASALPATTLTNNCYNSMFKGCTNLTVAPELPANSLASECYKSMFQGCSSLTMAPELPATTLAYGCYLKMFQDCSGLTSSPELPATSLAELCYADMFCDCTSLTVAPDLPATSLATSCYAGMFYNCTALVTAPALPATSLAVSCYHAMFLGCSNLTVAPDLPATSLVKYCYYCMFSYCSKLSSIKCMATSWANEPTTSWVNGVASTGTFTKASTMSGWPTGINGIPSGWTVNDEFDGSTTGNRSDYGNKDQGTWN